MQSINRFIEGKLSCYSFLSYPCVPQHNNFSYHEMFFLQFNEFNNQFHLSHEVSTWEDTLKSFMESTSKAIDKQAT